MATHSTDFVSAVNAGSGSSWLNPTNALADDANKADVLIGGTTLVSKELRVTDLTTDMPSASSVDGIQVTVNGSQDIEVSSTIQLFWNGTLQGNSKTLSLPTTNGNVTVGTTSDIWGTSITPSDTTLSDFGVVIVSQTADTVQTHAAHVQYVSITITYTVPKPALLSLGVGT